MGMRSGVENMANVGESNLCTTSVWREDLDFVRRRGNVVHIIRVRFPWPRRFTLQEGSACWCIAECSRVREDSSSSISTTAALERQSTERKFYRLRPPTPPPPPSSDFCLWCPADRTAASVINPCRHINHEYREVQDNPRMIPWAVIKVR